MSRVRPLHSRGGAAPVIVPDPVIVVLRLIAFFSAISGKPLDGGLMLLVAMRTRTGRVGMLVAWAWLGLHFFAK
jgi:hypothetical protein